MMLFDDDDDATTTQSSQANIKSHGLLLLFYSPFLVATFLETKFLITMTSVMLREVGTKFVTFHQV